MNEDFETVTLTVDDDQMRVNTADQHMNDHADMMLGHQEQLATETIRESLSSSSSSCLGPWMCHIFEGCHNGECGQCRSHTECQTGQVCFQTEELGECTACSDDQPGKQCPSGENCIEGVCLPERLLKLRLDVVPQQWRRLKEFRYQDLKVPCHLSFAQVSQPDEEAQYGEPIRCEIKVHGGSSRDLPKLSWRVILDEPHEDLAWGNRHLILRAEYNDQSMMRNALSLEFFRQQTQTPVSRWRYIWLQVNEEAQGMYLQVERMSDSFLERWGRSPTDVRYEADPSSIDTQTGASALVPLPDLQEYWLSYELKNGLSYAPLIDFIEHTLLPIQRSAWGQPESIHLAQVFHWGEYLRYLSIMMVIQNLDHIRKNYQIARHTGMEGQTKWEVYPWDLDLSWGCLYNDIDGTSLCDEVITDTPLRLGQIPDGAAPSYPTDGLYNLLIERSLTPQLAREHYENLLCDFTKPLDHNPALSRILQWRTALKTWLVPWLRVDDSSRSQDPDIFLNATDELERFVLARSELIQDQVNCSE